MKKDQRLEKKKKKKKKEFKKKTMSDETENKDGE